MKPECIDLDVSLLEAPQPLERIMQAAGQLRKGAYIKAIHRMHPCMLADLLQKNGFAHEIVHGQKVLIYIWHDSDTQTKEYIDGLIRTES